MKKTIFIAMMLIGMMGSAQTIKNPLVIKSNQNVSEKVWHMYEDDSSVIYYENTNRTQTIAYAKIVLIDLMGELTKPNSEIEEGDTVMYEWIITDTKVLRLVLNEKASLIAIREF